MKFLGQIEFSKKVKKSQMWSPEVAKTNLAITTGLGGGIGYLEGMKSNSRKGMLTNNPVRAISGKGWKRKLVGATLGAGLSAGVGYAIYKNNPYSPIGKKKNK